MPHYCPHCQGEIAPGALVKTRAPKRQPLPIKPPAKPNARSRIWQSMRMSPRFTMQEVAATSEATVANVGHMVRALIAVGYVRCVKASSGEAGEYAVYALMRDTGPHAPRLRDAGGIYDLNLQQEVVSGH